MRTGHASMGATYRVARLQDKATIRRVLNRDRGMGAYALGDLHSPHWERCEFYGAHPANGGDPDALVLRYTGFEPPLLVLFGAADGTAAILADILDQRDVYFTADETTYPLLARHFTLPAPDHMWRMVLPPDSTLPEVPAAVRPLRGEQGRALLTALFANVPDDSNHFSPSQVDDGTFYGIFSGEQLVACAGTHLISEPESVAGVGNVFTLPAYRGQGFASASTLATSHHLREQGISTIVLNVAQHNHAAIHIYEKLGYVRHQPFWEGTGHRRVTAPV